MNERSVILCDHKIIPTQLCQQQHVFLYWIFFYTIQLLIFRNEKNTTPIITTTTTVAVVQKFDDCGKYIYN